MAKNKSTKYTEAATVVASDTKSALQLLYGNINKGQQKQIVKVPEVKALFDRYGVEYER